MISYSNSVDYLYSGFTKGSSSLHIFHWTDLIFTGYIHNVTREMLTAWQSLSDWEQCLQRTRPARPGLGWWGLRCEELTDNNESDHYYNIITIMIITDGNKTLSRWEGSGSLQQGCSSGENKMPLISECHQHYITHCIIVQWIAWNINIQMGKVTMNALQWRGEWPQVICCDTPCSPDIQASSSSDRDEYRVPRQKSFV